ncbi:MAG TPA: TolC family protein [Turneriella sp.]|nr:TolC family protein [Turneriella sp.]
MKSPLFLYLFAATVIAAEPLKMSFGEAMQRLVAQNRDLQAARQNLETARLNYRGAYAGFLPQVTAGMNYTQGNSATTAQLAGVNTTYELYSASLGVNQNIFSGLADYYKIKQARANTELSEATYTQTAARVYYELKAAWSQLQLARAQHKLALETRARRLENVRMIRLRFNSGNENKGSLLLAESYLAQAERDVNQALRQKLTAETELRRVLNLPDEQEVLPEGSIASKAPPEAQNLAELSKQTPEYRQALAQELNAEATADAAVSPFFPTLNASGSLFRQGPTFFPERDRWSVTVGVSYPLFSGGKDYYALKANSSAHEASKRNRESVELARTARLQQALQTWRDALESAKVSESLLGASTVRAQIARVKYNNGLLSFDQWDIIENDLINRQKGVLQTRYDLEIAQAAWEQLTGEGPAL